MSVDDVVSQVPVVVPVLTLVVIALNAWWAWRAHQRAHGAPGLQARSIAVDKLAQAVHRLRALVRHSDVDPPSAQQVAAAMIDFEDCAQRHLGATPTHLAGIDRQVGAAMGNCYGPPAFAGWNPRLAGRPLAGVEHYWWEVTRSYLEHVNACLQHWRTTPTARPVHLVDFHAWRRDEDAEYFAPA